MPAPTAIFQTTLSHTEFAYLLKQFGARLSVGVDRDPLDGLSAEKIDIAYAVAGDAMRARGLVRLDSEQNLLIKNQLLQLLQVCANPRHLVTAFRYTMDDELPTVLFGYCRNGQTVMHTRPDDLLHELTFFDSLTGLLASLVAFCSGGRTTAPPRQLSLALPGLAVAEARNHAENGQTLEIVKVLNDANVPIEIANILASDLVSPSALTAITIFTLSEKGDESHRECIYWQSEANQSALLIAYAGSSDQIADQVLISDGDENSVLSIFDQMVQ